jgi:hypothetical protein
MSELDTVIRLLEGVRVDMREGFRRTDEEFRTVKATLERVEAEGRRTNGRVTKLEMAEQGGDERRKRWRDWVPQAVTAIGSTTLSVLLYALFLAH